jgi:hypothetical protein
VPLKRRNKTLFKANPGQMVPKVTLSRVLNLFELALGAGYLHF